MKEQKTERKAPSNENRFHANRAEIRTIGKERNVDVSTASRMWAHEKELSDYTDELREFEEYVAALQKETTSENNLVLNYFEGGTEK